MKDPDNYIDISKLSYKSKTLQIGIVKKWIKQAQIEAYNEAIRDAMNNVTIDVVNHEKVNIKDISTYDGKTITILIYEVDKDSILKLLKDE